MALVHFLASSTFGVYMRILGVDMQAHVDTLSSAIGFSLWNSLASLFSPLVSYNLCLATYQVELYSSFGSTCVLKISGAKTMKSLDLRVCHSRFFVWFCFRYTRVEIER